ncbi:hypothetical protein R1sor_025246 [Riccia sorocarpa]|uniref:Uncharacterized protein n=1 Tax=Riccia sorocarpa TaxID=122646 RepID=A0ABD3G827_9MARC
MDHEFKFTEERFSGHSEGSTGLPIETERTRVILILKISWENLNGALLLQSDVFETWLLNILREMLPLLVQTKVSGRPHLVALYFVCDRGRIQRRRLDGIDIWALKALLEIIRKSQQALEASYVLPEAKRNLIAVLFDFVLSELEEKAVRSQKQFPGSEKIRAVATSLCLAEASECYALAFKQGLPGVGKPC